MKILYVADVRQLKTRMHKISYLKVEALQKHPDFAVETKPFFIKYVPFTLLGGVPSLVTVEKLMETYNPDIIVHDALSRPVQVMIAGLERLKIPKVLMVEDYVPFKDTLDALALKKQFDAFITIPLVASQKLPNAHWIGHYIPRWFQDYGAKKDIDVLFYGQANEKIYPLRLRLKNLFAKQDLRFFAVPPRNHNYTGTEYVGEHLARTINRAHLTISCTSTANYLVKKYLEIPACMSTTIGDTNTEFFKVFPNGEGIVQVTMTDSDDEILDKAFKFLENPTPSKKAYEIATSRNPANYANRLSEICKKILEDFK